MSVWSRYLVAVLTYDPVSDVVIACKMRERERKAKDGRRGRCVTRR
jgi:hypothetical protein